jgi:hypothetical protein
MAEWSKWQSESEASEPVAARNHSATEKGRWRNGQAMTSYLWL